jgi:hypothetical protein
VDGRGGLAVQLLIDDRLQQRLERRLCRGELQRERSGALNQAAQFGVGRRQIHKSEGVVVARGARTCVGAGHAGSVPQAGNFEKAASPAPAGKRFVMAVPPTSEAASEPL